ncbi:MAG: NYN domain-containing protein [Acidimicrobiia bacterium]|nr:NYN domain-containing protein [Acidimicrobiia bacterium]
MASDLFDPLLDLALDVARQGAKAKPPVAPPPRLAPMVKFAKVPAKAKDAVLEVLESDEAFRARVLERATERSVGRIGMSFLERPDGWEDFVATMVGAADEPVIESSRSLSKLQNQLDAAQQARDKAENELAQAQTDADAARTNAASLARERDELELEVRRLQTSNAELVEQRRRAVAELKQTEAVMVRHVQERKRLELQVEAMTAAQLSTTAVGGGVTDVEVRASVDALDEAIDELRGHVDHLRRQATPERIQTARRTPLPVPPGIFDDSSEMADYLLAVPNMVMLVDGYNVTKEAHDEWDLEQQRDWLEQGLRALASRTSASFDVVFDGADVVTSGGRASSTGVRIRFSPDGVEADDVIIGDVASVDRLRPLTVVSSDKRVRSGARDGGANLLSSRQLLDALG